MVSKHLILEMVNIRKAFPGVVALNNVDFELKKGEVQALLGENGAGKSTLIKILSGAHRKDTGKIFLDNKELSIDGPRHAHQLGIFTIYQDVNLVPQLSVWENIFLGNMLGKRGVINKKEMIDRTVSLMSTMDYYVDPTATADDLSISEKQMLEIMKAVHNQVRVLILDEPTASLQAKETDKLFETIRQMKSRGVSVIYISHRLKEIKEICDRGMVLRNGEKVDQFPIDRHTNLDQIVKMMVGTEIKKKYPKLTAEKREKLLKVKTLSREGFFHGINFAAYSGEVMSIFGIRGCGNVELARALFGLLDCDEGEIVVGAGNRVIAGRGPSEGVRNGIFYLPADRKKEGLFLDFSVKNNIIIGSLEKLLKWGFISVREERSTANYFIRSLGIKTNSYNSLLKTLSGGNQAKTLLARAMNKNAKIVILCEPTSGVDVAGKVEIYQLINKLTKDNRLVIMISSELPEIMGMSDRILVMYRGRIIREFERGKFSQEEILGAALGKLATGSEMYRAEY